MTPITPDFRETRARELARTRRKVCEQLRAQLELAVAWLRVLGKSAVPFALGAVAFLPVGVLVVGVAIWGGR